MSEQWYDSEHQWLDSSGSEWFLEIGGGTTYSGLYQVWTDDEYVYAATTSGLYIIDSETEQQVAYVGTTCTTVVSDSDYVYIGTSSSGIKSLPKNNISAGGNLITSLSDYAVKPWTTSNRVKYIHCNEDNLISCTNLGIDIIRKNSGYITSSSVFGAQKCFVTPNNYYYYTVSGTNNWTLNRLNGNTSDWSNPDIVYTTGSGFLTESTRLNDFYVTEHTSISGVNNTLFIATDESIIVYDEETTEFIKYATGV